MDLFEFAEAAVLRDEGIARVSRPDFIGAGMLVIERLPIGCEFTGETIRHQVEAHGIHPHHPNAWGALVRCARRAGLLQLTGRYEPMKDPQSHGRVNPVYVRLRPNPENQNA